ncbi:ATP-binding protein [Solidesulfovibrio sp.]|uniref:two-component system sensor histidine kinase NtrB n=1 Tax=Solidesulfovibrio sp. TaxID=2910990 RepID=UPI0026079E87|nr:ATP-binding protein [Solidesulfovibrio sp.]
MESPTRSSASSWREALQEFLPAGEAWLMERVRTYAATHGYAAYTSSLVEAWRASIAGLTVAILDALSLPERSVVEYPQSGPARDDPIAAFADAEAARHRQRGVSLAMFWGLLKYYRRAYLEWIAARFPPGEEERRAAAFAAACFERMEYVFVLRWAQLSGQEHGVALARSEARYRTLIDLMHQGLAVLSPEGRVDFANDTLGELLGRPLADIVGRPFADSVRPEDRERFLEALAGRRRGLADPYEIGLCREDGRPLCVMASPSPIVGPDGDYQGSLEVYTDVTRLRQLESRLATAKRLEAIGHLAGGVAHEINTPLQYVSGNLEFARNNAPRILSLIDRYEDALRLAQGGPELEAKRREIEEYRRDNDLETVLAELPQALEESLTGTERVAGFVRSIKRFARAEGMGRQAIDVNEAILATVEMARSAQEFAVCLETDLADSLPPLCCVPGDFNQLLLCLLLNAAQATEQAGRADACVRVESRLEGGNVTVSVIDHGPGIPPEIQDKIFNPFYTTRDVGKGGGQGLGIALAIAEKHKGTLRFVTTPGRGTTFHVTFPLE